MTSFLHSLRITYPRSLIACLSLCALLYMSGCRTADDLPLRQPAAGRTHIFARGQMKYGLGDEYLRRWTDRPLFQDTALRNDSPLTSSASFSRMIDIARGYRLDGFAFLGETTGRLAVFPFTADAAPDDFYLLPEFVAGEKAEPKRQMLEAAIASPYTFRIDERIPITGYNLDTMPLDKWRPLIEAFRRDYGQETFLFLPDFVRPWGAMRQKHQNDEPITDADIEATKSILREWLDLFDGLHFAGASGCKRDHRFDEDYYRDVVIRTYREVLAEPAYAVKLLSLSATIGHENCTRIGYSLSHDGTKTLRHGMDAALAARPDIMVLPEWDEQNENTSLRPTVYNGTSTGRILRYYMQTLHNEPLSPLTGDDFGSPNLVISYRKIVVLGEPLEIEVLNVPDGSRKGSIQARLELRTPTGDSVWQSESFTLKADRLADRTLIVPSEELADHPVLLPVLHVSGGNGWQTFRDGLHHLQLRATWNWDYKWVKHPLRDLAPMRTFSFTMVQPPDANGICTIQAEVDCGEPLMSVEILDDDAVVHAVSADGQSLRERHDLDLYAVHLRSFHRKQMLGTLRVTGADAQWQEPQPPPLAKAPLRDGALHLAGNLDWYPRTAWFALPIGDPGTATLDVDLKVLKASIPLAEVRRLGIWSQNYQGATLTVSHAFQQPDHPLHLGKTSASFTARIQPAMPTSVLHLRAITASGRQYQSAPIMPYAATGETLPIRVWSGTAKAPVDLDVDAIRVPAIDYRFDADRQALMVSNAGRLLFGHLGGFTDPVTWRGGNGGRDGSAFVRYTTYPADATEMAPTWRRDGDRDLLEFDGKGTYINMPQGVLPRQSSFTLTFEILPAEVSAPQILFINYGSYIGSITVRLMDGRLHLGYVNDKLDNVQVDTGLEIVPGRWQRIAVSYDLEALQARVDGQSAGPWPCRGPGAYDVPSAFGGFGPGGDDTFTGPQGWFKGTLRSLRIVHRPYIWE